MFRSILLSTAALAAVSSAALAADLPNRKEAPVAPYVAPAPAFTWTGFYIGADIGGGWTNDTVRTFNGAAPAFSRYGQNASGVLGGLYAGYNFMLTSSLVGGFEGDIEATSLSSKRSSFTGQPGNFNVPAGNISATESLPWQGSLRARLGLAVNNALFYVTGGVAFAQFNTKYTTLTTNTFALVAGSNSFSTTQAGWTAGAGVEYAFNANWIGRVEYRYTQFGGFTDGINSLTNGGWNGDSAKHGVNENAVRVGIAYKFGAPAAPVVAKY